MSFSLRYRPEEVRDLDEASRWYDSRSSGLGKEFLEECKAALGRVEENPERFAADARGIKSMRISRFRMSFTIELKVKR